MNDADLIRNNKRQWNNIFKVLKKKCEFRILSPEKNILLK